TGKSLPIVEIGQRSVEANVFILRTLRLQRRADLLHGRELEFAEGVVLIHYENLVAPRRQDGWHGVSQLGLTCAGEAATGALQPVHLLTGLARRQPQGGKIGSAGMVK